MTETSSEHTLSPLPRAVLGFDGVVQDANEAWLSFFGAERHQMIDEVIHGLIDPAEHTQFLTLWESLAATDATVSCELRARPGASDPRPRTWLLKTRAGRGDIIVTIVGDGDSELGSASASGIRAELTGFSGAILKTLTALGNGIAVVDDNQIVWVNEAFCRIFETEPDRVIGHDGIELVAEHDRPRVQSMRDRRRAGEAVDPYYEIDAVTVSGRSIRVEIAIELMRLPDRNRTFLSCRDVTEKHLRRESEARLMRLESMGRVASSLGREFNDLVMAYTLVADDLRQQARSGPVDAPAFERLDDVTRRAVTLTRRLITFDGQPLSRPQSVDLNIVVWEAIEAAEKHLGIPITTRLTPGIPIAFVDRDLIETALNELLDNAVHASGGAQSVLVESTFLTVSPHDTLDANLTEGQYAVLRVCDDGFGISDEFREHVFEPFFTTRPREAAGLGLSTVYGIMRQLDGHVDISSNLRGGTDVQLFIPVDAVGEAPTDSTVRGAVDASSIRVLVVESSELLRELLEESLGRFGYVVSTARSEAEAFDVLEAMGGCEVVIAELTGEGQPGMSFVERIRQNWLETCVIMMSGRVLSEHATLPADLANLSFLHKPFSADRLDREIRRALENRFDFV